MNSKLEEYPEFHESKAEIFGELTKEEEREPKTCRTCGAIEQDGISFVYSEYLESAFCDDCISEIRKLL